MAALHDLTALGQAAAIAKREISAVELTQHYLERSTAANDNSGAFVRLIPELALAQARAADEAFAVADEQALRSPLHGVPCPVKDLNLVAGVVTEFGSSSFHLTPTDDDNVTSRMRSAGLVFTGKTSTPEFGLPCYTEPDNAPPARSPWGINLSAGGSSGGAAAAVAFGLAPIAQGSDGGGSIRIPSSMTGLVGIKPSRGRVSNGPIGDLIGDLGTNGPLARNVADAAALLDAMAGGFVSDPHLAHAPKTGSFLAAVEVEPTHLRIGVTTTPFLADVTVDTEVIAAVESTITLLTSLGHDVVEVAPPFDPSILPSFMTLWSTLASSIPVGPDQLAKLRPLTRYLRDVGNVASAADLANAVAHLRAVGRQAVEVTHPYDVLLVPTLARLPVQVGQLRDDADPAKDFREQGEFSPFCAPINITGQPAINVPVYWTSEGIPVGVQLIGRMYCEDTIISVAAQLERVADWTERKPPAW